VEQLSKRDENCRQGILFLYRNLRRNCNAVCIALSGKREPRFTERGIPVL
jgi:hypothetical protein